MANLTKLKRRNTLGAPPLLDEASQNLTAPEVAPATTEPAPATRQASVPHTQAAEMPLVANGQERRDGRSLRKTHRTLQFATRVSWEFDDKLRRIAQRDRLLLVQVLERALDAYEEARK